MLCNFNILNVNHEFLKPIKPRHMTNSESDVARFLWSCSNQENKFDRAAISKGWPTNPLTEYSSTNSLCPTNLWLLCSGHKAGTSEQPPQENLVLPGRTVDQGKSKLIGPWSAQQLTKAKELIEHVCYMPTVGKTCPICLQLAGTKSIWQGHVTVVTVAL